MNNHILLLRRYYNAANERLRSWCIPGEHNISIQDLANPFRYDIVARRAFFLELANNMDLYRRNPSVFIEQVRESEYFNWFCTRYIPRAHPHKIANEKFIRGRFAKRVVASANLYSSVLARGIDPDKPITLRSRVRVLPTETGIRLERILQADDGCHRMAILWAMGKTKLRPSEYRIRLMRSDQPQVNTGGSRHHGVLEPRRHLARVSRFYTGAQAHEFRGAVSLVDPEMLEEVSGVLKVMYPGSYEENETMQLETAASQEGAGLSISGHAFGGNQ
jgi:hypothetical protein